MNRREILMRTPWIVAALALLPGCGNDGPQLYEVEGRLLYRGEPLPGMDLQFAPVDGRRGSSATTRDEGRFKLYFTADSPGAYPGEHIVYLRYFPTADKDDGRAGEEGKKPRQGRVGKALQKYGDREKSPYRVTIDQEVRNLVIDLD